LLKKVKKQAEPQTDDFPCLISDDYPISIIHPISDALKEVLGTETCLSQAVATALRSSQVIWRSPVAKNAVVLKLSSSIVVKTIRDTGDLTEYTTLQYLDQHHLHIPVPKPHGVLHMRGMFLMFTSFIPGITLEKAWPLIDASGKARIRAQLEAIFCKIRALPFSERSQLGGVGQEGCKDLLRHVRRSDGPILNAEEFEEFKFSRPNFGSSMFIKFLRQLAPRNETKIVFTHGDVRPDNIIVEFDSDQQYSVTGVLDWEFSGFYPEYHESTKITNCLSPNDKSDWYLYLPSSITPAKYPTRWLLDRLWGRHIE
jgi:Phosphotransferase enzyme family